MTGKLEGGCLCGAVRYAANAEPMMVGNCYCTDCRKSSGTAHCTLAAVPEAAFSSTGELRFHEKPADSGNLVSRGFCPNCGSAILSRNSSTPGMTFIFASSLDDPNAVTPQMTVYASRAPAWAQLDRSKPVFDTMPRGRTGCRARGKLSVAYDEELTQRMRAAIGEGLDVTEKRMMGGICFFLNGNMVGGADRSKEGERRFMFRLGKGNPAAERLSGGMPVILGDRPMSGFFFVDADRCDDALLGEWLGAALDHARSLPAK